MSVDPAWVPVWDSADAGVVGWEFGFSEDGDLIYQVRCDCGCGRSWALRLPPGGYISHDPPGIHEAKDVEFIGPMKPAQRELPGG